MERIQARRGEGLVLVIDPKSNGPQHYKSFLRIFHAPRMRGGAQVDDPG